MQRERGNGGEDQREQMVEEVADVEQQEMQALAHGAFLEFLEVSRNLPGLCAQVKPRWPHGW